VGSPVEQRKDVVDSRVEHRKDVVGSRVEHRKDVGGLWRLLQQRPHPRG
jgi:hypothetical protein